VLTQAWPTILERLRTPDNEQGVRTWLASPKVRPVVLEAGVLTLECPTPLFQYTIRDRYARQLAAIAGEVLGETVNEGVCRVTGQAIRDHERQVGEVTAAAAAPSLPQRHPPRGWGHGFKLLEDFVVGTCNRLAFDAVSRIIDDPRNPVNPLFIHGA